VLHPGWGLPGMRKTAYANQNIVTPCALTKQKPMQHLQDFGRSQRKNMARSVRMKPPSFWCVRMVKEAVQHSLKNNDSPILTFSMYFTYTQLENDLHGNQPALYFTVAGRVSNYCWFIFCSLKLNLIELKNYCVEVNDFKRLVYKTAESDAQRKPQSNIWYKY